MPAALVVLLHPNAVAKAPVKENAAQPVIESQKEKTIVKTQYKAKTIVKPKTKPITKPTIDQLLTKYFGKYAPQAKKIMMCESGGNPKAKGDIGIQFWQEDKLYGASYGLFQVRYLKGRPIPDKLVDPEFNIRYASQLHGWHGWKPWHNCSKKLGL